MNGNKHQEEREEQALDALSASFIGGATDEASIPLDDPAILDEDDLRALDALGDDLVDRLLAGQTSSSAHVTEPPVPWASTETFVLPPEMTALHRGDELLTPEALEELERHRRELLEDEFEDCEE
jgi:hypothetical protein